MLVAGTDQMAFFASYLRHLLMLLDLRVDVVASPSQEALSRLGRIDAATLVIGLSAGRPHPLVVRAMKLARHRKAHDGGDHRRDALRGRQARPDQALLLLQQPRLRALAHGAAEPHPGARLRRLRAGHRAVRRPHQGLPAEVARRRAQARLGSHARRGDIPRQDGPRRDAQGRRDHGRRDARAGDGRRGGGRRCGDGARARAGRHPPRRRRRAHVRPGDDRGHPGGRDHPGDGQGAHRSLRRGPGAARRSRSTTSTSRRC